MTHITINYILFTLTVVDIILYIPTLLLYRVGQDAIECSYFFVVTGKWILFHWIDRLVPIVISRFGLFES